MAKNRVGASKLQSTSMMKTADVISVMPLVSPDEWEQYIAHMPPLPSPTTTLGRVAWWKQRIGVFPTLAPVAVGYLLTPRSAAQSERTFSLLGHSEEGA